MLVKLTIDNDDDVHDDNNKFENDHFNDDDYIQHTKIISIYMYFYII